MAQVLPNPSEGTTNYLAEYSKVKSLKTLVMTGDTKLLRFCMFLDSQKGY